MSDTVDLLAEYDRFEQEGGWCTIERDVVSVDGPDAGRYLQGQLSQEVVALADGSSTWSLLLQPTGKVDAWLRVRRLDDETYLLDVDSGFGEVLVARLQRFLLRTKASIGPVETVPFLAARVPATLVTALGEQITPRYDEVLAGGPIAGPPGVVGWDRALRPGAPPPAEPQLRPGTGEMTTAAYERYRIAHAVPAMGAELTPETIPAEAGQWLLDASVSFTKGCYTGQELVARIDSRGGNVPRPIRLLRVDGGPMPMVGGEVRSGDSVVGHVTSAAPWLAPHQPALALGPVARSVELGATVEVQTETGATVATVVEPPFVGHGPD